MSKTNTLARRAKQIGAGIGAAALSGAALAQSAAGDVVAKVEEGGANGIAIAVAVVLALWGISAIYMMRRKS